LRYNLQISLEDAFRGKQQTITLTTSVACDACHGTGAEKGAQPITCTTCSGRGKVRVQQGFFTIERTCHTCQGTGKIIENPCRKCAGTGTVRKDKTIAVNIPQGWKKARAFVWRAKVKRVCVEANPAISTSFYP
jgi:molecular chaperone DnaJ